MRGALAHCALVAVALAAVAGAQDESWVAGRVRNAAGNGVDGAEVLLLSREPAGLPDAVIALMQPRVRTVMSARTTADGRFLIRYVHDGEFGLVAVDARGLRSQPIAPIAPGSTHVLTLRSLVSVEARVEATVGGTPISAEGMTIIASVPVRSGVGVIEEAEDAFGEIEHAVADAQGRVRVHVLDGTECRLSLCGSGSAPRFRTPPQETVLMTAKFVRCRLRVVDSHRAPIVGATVSRLGYGREDLVETDAEGVASFLTTFPDWAAVTAPGYRWTGAVMNEREVQVELESTDPVRLEFHDAGRPLATRTLLIYGIAGGSGTLVPCVRKASTDVRGAVELFGRSAFYGLIVWLENDDGYRRVFDLAPGRERVDRRAIDVAPTEYVGRVLTAGGAGATHTPILPISMTDPFGHRFGTGRLPIVFCDHAGRFRLRTSRSIALEVAVPTAQHPTVFETLPSGPDEPIELRLALGRNMEGVVVDSFGDPIAGQRVTVSCLPEDSPASRFGLLRRSTVTDHDGRFTFPQIAEGEPHFVTVTTGGAEPSEDSVTAMPGDREIVLTLPGRN